MQWVWSERPFGKSSTSVGQLTMAQMDTRHQKCMVNMLPKLDSMVSVRYLITRIFHNTMEQSLRNTVSCPAEMGISPKRHSDHPLLIQRGRIVGRTSCQGEELSSHSNWVPAVGDELSGDELSGGKLSQCHLDITLGECEQFSNSTFYQSAERANSFPKILQLEK